MSEGYIYCSTSKSFQDGTFRIDRTREGRTVKEELIVADKALPYPNEILCSKYRNDCKQKLLDINEALNHYRIKKISSNVLKNKFMLFLI